MNWMLHKTRALIDQIEYAKAHALFPYFRPISHFGPLAEVEGRPVINYTSNDYLGLSQHPNVKERAIEGIRRYGTGLGSSRLQATTESHESLEKRLADWLGAEEGLVFTSGYQALVGFLSSFLDDKTTVVSDRFIHASALDGIHLAKGMYPSLEERFFKHNDVSSLERILDSREHENALVVVEGLYSADGDIAPLNQIAETCHRYDAQLLVDDAHGIGCLGPSGRGVADIYGVFDKIDVLVGTFSKSFGGVGGFLAAKSDVVRFLKMTAKSFVFSAALPVGQIESAHAALDILLDGDSERLRLQENTAFFRQGVQEAGFDTGTSESHITPIMVGDEMLAFEFAARLYREAGVLMLPFVYPGVPKGQARLRCNVTSGHRKLDMVSTFESLRRIGTEMGLIGSNAMTNES